MGPRRQTVNAPRETKTHISQTSYNEVRSERTFSMASIRNSHEKVISSSIDSTGPLHENPSMIITPSPRKSNDVKHKTQLQKKGTVISPDDVLVALDKYAIDENSPQNDLNNRPATNLLDTESMKETQRRLFSKFVPPFPHRESIDESTPVKNKAKGSQHRDPVDSSLEDDFDFITRLRMAASNDEFENESDETHHHERFNDDSTPDKTNYLEKVNVDSTADGTEVTLFALNKLNILEDDDERVAALSWEDVDDRSGTSETAEHKAVSQVHEHTDGKALFPQDDTNANMIDVSAENSFLGTPTKGKDIDEPKGLFSMPLCGTDCYVETPEKSMQYNQSNFFSSNVQEMEGWCGNDLYCTENPFNSKREIIEKSIGKLLTTEGSWCNGWHMWGLYLDDEKPVDIPMDPVVIRGIFQNRAGNLKGRSRRIKTLHHNIAPFQQYHKDHFSELKKSSSFGIEKINSLKSQSSSTSSFLGIQACMRPDPSKMVIDEYQEELCYDSDPGTISRERTRDVFTVSNHETRSHDSPIMLRQRNRRKRMADSFQSHNPSFKSIERINLNDAATVTSLVQDTMNRTMTLVWHPTPDESGKPPPPVSVIAFIERGHQIRTSLIQPKFVWKRKHDYNDKEGISRISNEHMNGIDLLDISHVLTVKKVDRKKYPLARTKHCFTMKYFTETALFGASSESERDRIVLCLKLTVARLGSMIITNDNTFFEEFFHLHDQEVPGHAPDVF